MIQLVFSPQGFYGVESIFEIVSVIVTFLLAFLSFRVYRFSKEKKFRYFGLSFAAISLSYIFKILMNVNMYYNVLEKVDLGTVTYTIKTFHHYPVFSITALILYRFIFLLGLVGLYYIMSRSKEKDKLIFLAYFALLIAATSAGQYFLAFQMFFLFHMTAALLLALITYNSLKNYSKKKNSNTLFVTFSFASLLLSQLMFMATVISSDTIYIVSEIIQFAGYSTLAVLYYKMVSRKK